MELILPMLYALHRPTKLHSWMPVPPYFELEVKEGPAIQHFDDHSGLPSVHEPIRQRFLELGSFELSKFPDASRPMPESLQK